MGSDPDHINPISQFCPCMGKHSFHHTLDCFSYPYTEVSYVTHKHSANIIFHILPQEEIQGHDTRGAWGPRDWSTADNPSARICLVKKCPHIVTAVCWHTILFENDEQLQFFKLWDHIRLMKPDTPCDSLLIKEI
jgi:hypothetical protein